MDSHQDSPGKEDSDRKRRGRPLKELDEISSRSLRRRIASSFVLPPPPRLPSPLSSPLSSPVKTAHHLADSDHGSLGVTGDGCDLEKCLNLCSESGDEGVISQYHNISPVQEDSNQRCSLDKQCSDLCSVSGDTKAHDLAGISNNPEKSENVSPQDHDISVLASDFQLIDEVNADKSDDSYVRVLGILHYDCDLCINCQCIDCETCIHKDNGMCSHCDPCGKSDLHDTSDNDEDDLSEEESVEDIEKSDEDEEVCILSEEDKANAAMKTDLLEVIMNNNLTHAAVTDILGFLRKYEVGNLPKTAKTLLKTVDVVPLREVPPGQYWHNGVTKYLMKYARQFKCSVINVKFSSDGVLVFESTSMSFWPLSCMFNDHPEVVLVGLYLGSEKPKDPNVYFKDFVEEISPLCQNGLNVDGKVVAINVVCGIFDAPATCFALNVKYFNAYSGCFKCTTEGELIQRTMSYPELNAPLRTDESFARKEQRSYHKGRTVLEDIPGFGCISCVPLDYMHLLLLGVMRKLMYMWIGGPLSVRLSSRQVTVISDSLLSLIGWIPSEFTRRTVRTLSHIRRFKATEFRLILLYVGIVVFRSIPRPLYEHFLVFHVIATIFVDRSLCQSHVDYAQELAVYFVETFIELYGRQYVSHNVHSLIHVHSDIRNFDNLDKFSAFPFENFYKIFRKIVRKGEKPLQQAAKRYSEFESSGCKSFSKEASSEEIFRRRRRAPHSGILLEGCINPQYSSFSLPGGYTISCTQESDKCVVLQSGSIVLAENFASNSRGEIVLIGREFTESEDFFTVPCPSSVFGIMYVCKPSGFKVWPASQIIRKCFRMPWKRGFVVVPLHKH